MNEIYVGNFIYTYTEQDLRNIFKNYGIKHIRMYKEKTKAFAFITLSSAQDVHNIVKDMNNTVADGRILLIRVAKKQKTSNSEGSGSSESDHSSSSGECVDSTTGIRTHNNYGIPRTTQPLNEIDYSTMPGLEPLDTSIHSTQSELHHEPLGRVAVSNFPYGSSEAEIMNIFVDFEPVMCRIMINAPTGKISNPTYAFVYVQNSRMALAAEKSLNNTCFRGAVLGVKSLAM